MPGPIVAIQIVRAFAAVLVVLWHLPMLYAAVDSAGDLGVPRFLQFGYAGVDFFFVVSGFIISHITAQGFTSPSDFLARRAVRILPFYALFTVIVLLDRIKNGNAPEGAGILFSFLGLPLRELPVLQPGWSLEHEAIFYFICAAAMALNLRDRLPAILAGLFAGGIVLHVLVREFVGVAVWDFHLLSLYHFEFLLGVLVHQHAPALRRFGSAGPLLAATVVACGTSLYLMRHGVRHIGTSMAGFDGLARVLGFGLGGALLIVGLLNMEARLRAARWLKPVVLVGDASFALYISHIVVFEVVFRRLQHWEWTENTALPALAAAVGVAIGFAILFYLCVEKPLLRLAHRPAPPAPRPMERAAP